MIIDPRKENIVVDSKFSIIYETSHNIIGALFQVTIMQVKEEIYKRSYLHLRLE